MISPKHVFAWATAALTGALMAASFQTPAMAGEGPERPDDSIRYEAPIARPSAAPVAGYVLVTGDAVPVTAGGTNQAFATCDGGRRVLGGGWISDATALEVTSARAIAEGAVWQVTFHNPSDDGTVTAAATAQCGFAQPSPE